MEFKTVSQVALRDIAEYTKGTLYNNIDSNGDVWIVTAKQLQTKENRRLNKELGISKVNYTK